MRRRVWAIIGGTVAALAALIGGIRNYESHSPGSSDSSISLLLTALNTRDPRKASGATYALSEQYPAVAPLFRNAMAVGLNPRRIEAIEHLDDPALQSVVLDRSRSRPWVMLAAPYEEVAERLSAAKDLKSAEALADRLIDLDPERARRDLPPIMKKTGLPVIAWTRIDNDDELIHARTILESPSTMKWSLATLYRRLAVRHPAFKSRKELDAFFRRSGLPVPVLDSGTESAVARAFRPYGLGVATTMRPPTSSWTIPQLEQRAAIPHEYIRESALHELAWRDPKRAARFLEPMLRSKSASHVERACIIGTRDVPGLLIAARHPDWRARVAAARVLFSLRDPISRRAVKKLRKDPARFVRLTVGAR